MSYKHNNLMAMRQSWWEDESSASVQSEKRYLQTILSEQGVFEAPSIDDVKYFFFSLPSIIIVKGYALGFTDPSIKELIQNHIESNKQLLIQKHEIKIQFRM